ncbi:MAG: NifB/NifX family molybdenum-iron cluster-binding protein [Thermoplasmatota archaeon]
MKIAVSSDGETKEDNVETRFGRCAFFVVYDSETNDYHSIDNGYKEARGGAGIQVAQMLAENGIGVVITGNVGPNAYRTLESADIEVYTASGKISEVIENYKRDELKKIEDSTVRGHYSQKRWK